MLELNNIVKPYTPFLNNLSDGVVATDLNAVFVYANASAIDLIGLPLKKIIGSTFSEIFSNPDFFEKVKHEVGQKKKVNSEVSVFIKNKKKIFSICTALIYDQNSDPVGVYFIFLTTPSIPASLAYLEGEIQVLPALRYHTDEAVVISDISQGRYVFCSDSIEVLSGWLPEDYLNGGWAFVATLTHPDDVSSGSDNFEKALKLRIEEKFVHDHIPIINIYRIRHRDGSFRWVRTQSFVLERNKNGDIKHLITFIRDITLEKIHGVSMEEEVLRSKVTGGFLTLWSTETKGSVGILLSSRERQILEMVKNGFNTKYIANELSISAASVNSYRKKIMEKLGAKNSAEMIRKGYELKIFQS